MFDWFKELSGTERKTLGAAFGGWSVDASVDAVGLLGSSGGVCVVDAVDLVLDLAVEGALVAHDHGAARSGLGVPGG